MLRNATLDSFACTKPPAERQHGRRNAKSDHVGNGVKLKTKITRCLGQTGDTPVQTVKDITYSDENGCVVPVPTERRDYRVVAAEYVSDCEEAGDNRKARSESRTFADTPPL